jgi:hypothetical protein
MNSRTQDFNLIATVALDEAVKEWGKRHPDEIEAALTNINKFIQTGKTPRGSKVYFDFFVEHILPFTLGTEEAGRIARDALIEAFSDLESQGSKEERWVLYTLCSPSLGSKPKPYYESMIRTISIALSEAETLGFASQLAGIHPELCKAVHDYLTGKLDPGKCRKR